MSVYPSNIGLMKEGEPCSAEAWKVLSLIMSSFGCPNKCPWCTAKITRDGYVGAKETTPDDFAELLERLRILGARFDYFFLSGNGEPSLYDADVLQGIKDVIDRCRDLFLNEDVPACLLTGGHIFFEPEKWKIFKDWVFEITRYSWDPAEEESVTGPDYTGTETFAQSKVTFNMVLLKGRKEQIIDDVNEYLRRYPNMVVLNLKMLNVNTLDPEKRDSPWSRWILENGMDRRETSEVVELMDANFERVSYDEWANKYVWCAPDGRLITFRDANGDVLYGRPTLVVHEGRFTNYALEDVNVS